MCEMSNQDANGGQIIEWRFFASSGQQVDFSAWIKSEAPDWHTTLAIQNPSYPYTQFAETKANASLLTGARLTVSYEINDDNFRESGGNFVAQIKIRKIVAKIWVDDIELKVGTASPPPAPLPVPSNINFQVSLRGGLNFVHVPLADPSIKTIADVYHKIGDGLQMIIFYDQTVSDNFESYYEPFNGPEDPVNIAIKPYTGLIVVMSSSVNKTVIFTGQPFSNNQVQLFKGKEGLNLIGLPVNDPRVTKFSQLASLSQNIIGVAGQGINTGQVKGWPGVDLAIQGGQSVLVFVSQDTTLTLSGEPWSGSQVLAAPSLADTDSSWQSPGLADLRDFLDNWRDEFVFGQKPNKTKLLANYPNPFNPETWIPFELSGSSRVSISIFDLAGRLIKKFDLGYLSAGQYLDRNKAVYWDGRSEAGEKLPVAYMFIN